MPRRTRITPAPPQPISVEGLNVLEFLRGVCSLIGKYDILGNELYYDLYSQYVDTLSKYDLEIRPGSRDLERKWPGLRIIKVRMEVVTSGHNGYCSDHEADDEFVGEPGVEGYDIALPEGLVGNVEDIRPEQFDIIEQHECWCGGVVSKYTVIGIDC